jgi:hypothetical protein
VVGSGWSGDGLAETLGEPVHMNDHDDHQTSLRFYCRVCEVEFESLPDESGYEQVECPQCNEMCMTVEFEEQERERHRSREAIMQSVVSILPLPHIVKRLIRPQHVPHQQTRDTCEPVTVVRYDVRLHAEKDMELLAREGIDATLHLCSSDTLDLFTTVTTFPIFDLRVPSPDVVRARDILRETDSPETECATSPKPAEDVSFKCEECGAAVSFPGRQRGKVDTCPHCYEYVDVPE